MTDVLTAVLGFAVLFALFGVYGLLRPRRSCSGGCGSCASADTCGLPEHAGRGESTARGD